MKVAGPEYRTNSRTGKEQIGKYDWDGQDSAAITNETANAYEPAGIAEEPMFEPDEPDEAIQAMKTASVPAVRIEPVGGKSASASQPAQAADMQSTNEGVPDKPKKHRKLIVFVIVLLLAAVLGAGGWFGYQKLQYDAPKTLTMQEATQYRVPDGLMQEGYVPPANTEISYIYDAKGIEDSKVVEYHAIVDYEVLGQSIHRDLADDKDPLKDISFAKTVSDLGNVSNADNAKAKVKLDVHVPEEARSTVEQAERSRASEKR